jgi:hypothetical protein
MNGIQSLMQGAAPQRPQPIRQPRPAMPNMADPRMSTALGLVDDDLERAGIDPRTRAAMKAQEAVDLLASADADMAMGQPKPTPEKIIDQRKQQASEGIVGLLQQLMPGMQQRGQQMQRRLPMGGMPARPPMGGMPARPAPARPPMGGMAARPAPARPPMGGMPARPAPARPPMGGMPAMGAPNMARMADGGIVGYAQGGKPTPTLGAVPPSAVGDEQIKQFAEQYTALQAGLAAATTPQDKAQAQQLMQALIRDMGNEHAKVMQYIDSTKGFVAPRSQMARGGIIGYSTGGRAEQQRQAGAAYAARQAKAAEAANLQAARNRKFVELLGQGYTREQAQAMSSEGADLPYAMLNPEAQGGDVGGIAQAAYRLRNPTPSLIDDTPVGTFEGGMGDPQTETTTKPEQEILERMRTNQAAVTSTTRTPSALATQLEAVLGKQLGALDGARDKETALAEAALGMSEAEKQAAEDIVKADEAYYGKVLDPAERRRRENEVIMQAYLSGNSLVDQARRSGAAQSQLRRQGYTQEREAAKVRPTATKAQEEAQRGIRGEVYAAGRDAEKDARSTLNQTIQTTGNYINSIANREARAALESSSQSMQILKAEMDLLLAGKQLDADDKDRVARAIRDIRDNIINLEEASIDILGDPIMDDADKQSERTKLKELIGQYRETIRLASERLGLPTISPSSTGGGDVIDFTDL